MDAWTALKIVHVVGLMLGVGAATAKLRLLLRCGRDAAFVRVFLGVARALTHQIVLGLALLTASGLGWLWLGFPLTRVLVWKIVLVVAIWIVGPVIDKVVEPRFAALAPAGDGAPSAEFLRVWRQYLVLEVVATGAFYVIVAMWLLS